MNEIIVHLEGKEYQIDVQKAKELGVIKEKDPRCKSWEEFKLKYKKKKGFIYDDVNKNILTVDDPYLNNEQLTGDEAIAIIAFSKLLKLRRDWIGTWNPDWSDGTVRKYYIYFCPNKFYVNYNYDYSRAFAFPTKEMAEEFLKCFKDLFEQCKILI